MTSPLSNPLTFRLNVPVSLPRNMMEAEAQRYLATGELPDFSKPPSERATPLPTTEADHPEVDVLTDQDVRLLLAGRQASAVVAAGSDAPEQTHQSHHSNTHNSDENVACGCSGVDADKAGQTGTELSALSSSQGAETPAPVGEPSAKTESIDVAAAAGEVHTGAMIALVPTVEDAERLAIDGGEEPEELHITLCYLGEAALLSPEVRGALVERIGECVAVFPTIIGKIFAVNLFNPAVDQPAIVSSGGFDPNQPRDAHGKWVDVPGVGAVERLAESIHIGATAADAGNPSYRPDSTKVAAVQRLTGHNVSVTAQWGGAMDAELLDVGTTQGGAHGVHVRANGTDMFLPWGMLQSIDDKGKRASNVDKSANSSETPYSAAFAAETKDALHDIEAMNAVPMISEHAPIEQHWALGSYQAEGYGPVNHALRTGDMSLTAEQNRGEDGIVSVSVRENISDLDKLLDKSTTSSDILVYRGIRLLKSLGVDPNVSLEGLEWSDPAYTSTSANRTRASGFVDKRLGEGTGAVLRILVPKNTHAVNLGYDEQEVLLSRNTHYKVVADNGVVNGVRQLDVKVIPND